MTRTIPVRPEIRALRAYRLEEEEPLPVKAKLDFNESPDDVPEDVRAEVIERLKARRWGRYPEFGTPRLKKAIAASIGRSPDEIVVGNGSGETILAAVSVFAGGGTLVLAPPTFALYGQIAAIASARVVPVRRAAPDFSVDEAAFLAQAARGVPLLCTPNNPTGGVSSLAFVEQLLDAAPVVLLDQAYVEFAGSGRRSHGSRRLAPERRRLPDALEGIRGRRLPHRVCGRASGPRPGDRQGRPAVQRRPRRGGARARPPRAARGREGEGCESR